MRKWFFYFAEAPGSGLVFSVYPLTTPLPLPHPDLMKKKKMPIDAEDMKDGGVDEADEGDPPMKSKKKSKDASAAEQQKGMVDFFKKRGLKGTGC